jgi:hypothetical protein
MNDTNQIRQGDVLCDRINAIPAGLAPVRPDADRSVTLAQGEVTGHRHRFRAGPDGSDDSMLYAIAGEPARLTVSRPAMLVHEEHDPHVFPPGTYRISRPWEYQGAELIRVED